EEASHHVCLPSLHTLHLGAVLPVPAWELHFDLVEWRRLPGAPFLPSLMKMDHCTTQLSAPSAWAPILSSISMNLDSQTMMSLWSSPGLLNGPSPRCWWNHGACWCSGAQLTHACSTASQLPVWMSWTPPRCHPMPPLASQRCPEPTWCAAPVSH
ncbi:alkB, alkylation repair homolog 6 (E. coli), isoform CRA_b, partial [Mus musculus]